MAVHSVSTVEEHVYVAMELVDGQTLKEWRDGGRRGWREVIDKYRSAGHGLAAAHALEILHRSLVEFGGTPYESDFRKVADFVREHDRFPALEDAR